jgi:hypothetical protein
MRPKVLFLPLTGACHHCENAVFIYNCSLNLPNASGLSVSENVSFIVDLTITTTFCLALGGKNHNGTCDKHPALVSP